MIEKFVDHNSRELKQRGRRRQQERQKAIGVARASRFFLAVIERLRHYETS